MEVQLDKDWNIKKLFRDSVKITFYRKEFDKKSNNLVEFFSDYYKVSKISDLSLLDPKTDILNCLKSPDTLAYPDVKIWQECDEEPLFSNEIFYGAMKDLYIRLFLEHCSA